MAGRAAVPPDYEGQRSDFAFDATADRSLRNLQSRWRRLAPALLRVEIPEGKDPFLSREKSATYLTCTAGAVRYLAP